MSEATSEKPVFIDQMPEYQQAMQTLSALARSQDRKVPPVIGSIAQELGLDEELNKTAERLIQVAGDLQKIQDARDKPHARGDTGSTIISLAGGGIAGIAAGKAWGAFKGIVAGAVTALAGMTAFSYARRAGSLKRLDEENAAVDSQSGPLYEQADTIKQEFMAQIATKMLAEQKMLVGQGPDVKLVSDAQTTVTERPAESMVEKHAVPPAASHADAAQRSQDVAAVQQR